VSGKRTQLDTRDAEAKAEKARRFLATERKLQERIAKLHERLLEARNDFHLSPDRIARAVQVAMQLTDKKCERTGKREQSISYRPTPQLALIFSRQPTRFPAVTSPHKRQQSQLVTQRRVTLHPQHCQSGEGPAP
jgi:hypothetical protein